MTTKLKPEVISGIAARYEIAKEAAIRSVIRCAVCGEPHIKTRPDRTCCTDACRYRLHNALRSGGFKK